MAQVLTNIMGSCVTPAEHRAHVTFKDGITVEGDVNLPISLTGDNYAVAVSTWVRAAVHGSYVMCRAATDPVGTLTDDAEPFIVYLPRSIATKDPNVYAGDILQYVTVNGINYAVGEAYLDAKIGDGKWRTNAGTINGWLMCDGTGTTTDMRGRFLRGSDTYGTPGGSDTHTHTGEAADESLSVGGTIDSATTGITIDNHPDHAHSPRDTPVDVVEDPAGRRIWGALECTSVTKDASCTGPDTNVQVHGVNDAGHTHTVSGMGITPNPHSHDVSIDSGSNVPAYIDVVWYVRTGPSGEIT
jgi:hypothetical protein